MLGVIGLVLALSVGGIVVSAKLNAARAIREAREAAESIAPLPTTVQSSRRPTPSTGPTPSTDASGSGSRTPSASSPSATASASGPSNPGGRPAEKKPRYTYAGRGAEDNRLYNTVFAAGDLGCTGIPLRTPPIADSAVKGYSEQIVSCLVSQLKAPLAQQGYPLTTPKIVPYDDDITTPCGLLALRALPALYCSSNQTIYMNVTVDDTNFGYYGAEMGYWMILTHEFGHHLQNTAGVFGDYTRWYGAAGSTERRELSRRLELQATCLGGVQLNAMWTSLKLGPSDYAQMDYFNANSVDTNRDHGSGANNKRWFDRGYTGDWSSFGDCNTWRAKDGEVG